jgi:hypothetical protein
MITFAEMIENDYGIKRKGTNVQTHKQMQSLRIIWTFSKENMDEENP